MLVYDDIVLCSAEWKSIASSRAVIMKQFVKNLRVNNSILHELWKHLDDNSTIILGMDWKGANNNLNTISYLFRCLNTHFLFFLF